MTKIPILRKDFIVDPWQVWETRAAGADSFLADRRDSGRCDSAGAARARPLAENGSRWWKCIRARNWTGARGGARIIGVNNRDLRDFQVHVETSLELVEAIPEIASRSANQACTRMTIWFACARRIRRFSDRRASDEERRSGCGFAGACCGASGTSGAAAA